MSNYTYDPVKDLFIPVDKPAPHYSSKENPYLVFVSKKNYAEIKQYLDDEDLYACTFGWIKVVVCN